MRRTAGALLAAALAAAGCGPRREAPAAPGAAGEPPGYQGPTLVLDSPARGEVLAAGGTDPWPVTVRGRACDPVHRLVELRLGGERLALPSAGAGPCFPFEATVSARLGLTVVTVEAENDAGQTGALAQAILRSPEWFAPGSGPGAAAPAAVAVQLGPTFLDDGDRATPDDLATLLERALARLDLDAAVGPLRFADPDADGDGRLDTRRYDCLVYTVTSRRTGFEAWKSGPASVAVVRVERLALAPGGIEARLLVAGLRLPFSVTGSLDSGCLGGVQDTVSGVARADALSVAGRASVTLGPGGAPEVAFPALAADLSGLSLDVDLGPLAFTGLGEAIGDAVAARVRGRAQEAVQGSLRPLLEERISRALAAAAAVRREVALPAALGGGRLVVEASLDGVDFTEARGVLTAGLRVAAASPLPGRSGPLGAVRLGGAPPDASGLSASPVAVGLADDALNQLLHAAWQAGAFDLSLDVPAPGGGSAPARLSLAPRLPPALLPQAGGAPWVDLALGDVAFTLSAPAPDGVATAHGFLSVVLPVDRADLGPAGLSLAFGGSPLVRVEVTDVNWDRPPAARAATAALLQRTLEALLPGLLEGALRPFPVPGLDLAAIDPSLGGIALLPSGPLARLGRYQFLTARLGAAP